MADKNKFEYELVLKDNSSRNLRHDDNEAAVAEAKKAKDAVKLVARLDGKVLWEAK